MPLTALDPRTALIVIDLQEGIRNAALLHPMSDIVACSNQLIDAFREQNLPIVFVTVNGTAPGRTERAPRLEKLPDGFADLMPELRTRPGDTIVTKRTWGAFANTNLEEILKKRGVTQVVLSGVATATGVESTARQAYEAGFHVTLVIDAMSDTREEAHAYSLKSIFPRLGETCHTQDILNLLEQRRVPDELAL